MRTGNALAVCVLIALAAPARAQVAEAESLFRDGKRLMKQGAIAAACDKFDASEKLEASVGTELNLADCRERNGQIASAWGMFLRAASGAKRAGDVKRATEARRRAHLLDGKLTYLTVDVTERIDGLAITKNAVPIDPMLWNQRVPIDPGTYTLAATAPGRAGWEQRVTIDHADQVVEVPTLAPNHEHAPPPPVAPDPATPRRYTRPMLGLAIGAATGFVVGIGFGIRAGSLGSDADAICPHAACLDPHALDLNARARTSALVANLGLVGGSLALVGAGALWWLGRPRDREAPAIVPTVGPAGVAIGGRW